MDNSLHMFGWSMGTTLEAMKIFALLLFYNWTPWQMEIFIYYLLEYNLNNPSVMTIIWSIIR